MVKRQSKKRNPLFKHWIIRAGYGPNTKIFAWVNKSSIFKGRYTAKDFAWQKNPLYPVIFRSRGNAEAWEDALISPGKSRVVQIRPSSYKIPPIEEYGRNQK